MEHLLAIGIDLAAICLLTFGLYFPRHRRRDLVVAYLGVNVGVLAVSSVLASTEVSFGLGLGLFGVLSIIRLRSYEIDQREVAYYFAALTIGLLAGLTATPTPLSVALIALVVLAIAVGDSPRLFRRYRQQNIVVDRVFSSEAALIAHLEGVLGAVVHRATIKRIDLANDTTLVDVRYEVTDTEHASGPRRVEAGVFDD